MNKKKYLTLFICGFSIVSLALVVMLCRSPRFVSFEKAPKNLSWSFIAKGKVVCTPSVEGDSVYLQTTRYIYALRASDGNKLWQTELPANSIHCIPPLISDDLMFVEGENSKIVAIQLRNGKSIWQSRKAVQGGMEETSDYWIADITSNSRAVYVARYNSYLTAYDSRTGEILWSKAVPDRASLFVFLNPEMVILVGGSLVRAYDNNSGELLWEKNVGMQVISAALERKKLFLSLISNGETSLSEIDIDTLQIELIFQSQELGNIKFTNIYNDSGSIYLSGNGIAAISSQSREILWVNHTWDNLMMPVQVNGYLYVQENETHLHVLNSMNGFEVGRIDITSNYWWMVSEERAPVVAEENILLLTIGKSTIFAYRLH